MVSLFDLFKIGIGPSSSHTVGPMRAAGDFAAILPGGVARLRVTLYGSLAWTGKGHATDRAVILGLAGLRPDTVEKTQADACMERAGVEHLLRLNGADIAFDPQADVVFDYETPATFHPNTMQFEALDAQGSVLACQRVCSVGGGFVVPEEQLAQQAAPDEPAVPFDFVCARELLELTRQTGLSIAEIVLANEVALRPGHEVGAHISRIIEEMMSAVERGMHHEGVLPGKLAVRRRAPGLRKRLEADRFRNLRTAHEVMDWVSLFAIAVNEENAAGGRLVTAPTNGAAGVLPAVLRYYRTFCPDATKEGEQRFILTATAIGGLFKRNASISGAEVGCQGEVGVACSMAAGGLAAALGGGPEQIENAAEIGMEHHLGMTCDPVGGLVQIPCIERNAFGAVKAINAASLALRGDGSHHVSLDQVIATMKETGADMSSRYKETSQGGLAVCFPEC
ncbi:L-serine ammonia-lyase [Acetobacter suratthaniensis]|uniref:L-serine dehydratase n=1 Tax=Acetobacter suratthaniensis TaxID=1502841 RepID=A0ABS3LK66_9PROT|nr:L-serine ammonia-lyase [Acetobacter suratthaniensis]MBO1327979.1 L-serine ammonia-lyase [Acetobacter suratthaniensis]MCX2566183.1 L-serine ammonia-lyase [Acetobacter suratthaniensis]